MVNGERIESQGARSGGAFKATAGARISPAVAPARTAPGSDRAEWKDLRHGERQVVESGSKIIAFWEKTGENGEFGGLGGVFGDGTRRAGVGIAGRWGMCRNVLTI
ncbi:hypothetical protein I350_08215 [Cryptococcus amylolentus CBS 6273]|uniref:Uncharacterized protein n=1 Tax=Cryptococcus amylolentus CBS 6273 TaxID=1296118 RepID=A0A1E3J5Q4_9TREE|nr:hypothetical protein I350_08215 [Cryptococcus amylolentus CBS 6273]